MVRSIAHQLLSGLAELHDQHAVVHRDIKPSNLLLREPFVKRKARVGLCICCMALTATVTTDSSGEFVCLLHCGVLGSVSLS